MSKGVVLQNKVTTLDKIRKYYLKGPDKVVLTQKQEHIRLMILKSWNLLCNYHSENQAMSVLVNDGCSQAQAYRYLTDCKSIFGDVIKNNKEAKRFLLEEDLIRVQQKAIQKGDLQAELKAIALRYKVSGVADADDKMKFDQEKFSAQTYIIKTDPKALEIMKSRSNGGAYDFNLDSADDVEYKEVENTNEDE